MPRFVLLYHDCPPTYARASHWDLMLESGDLLRTWALEKLPRDWNNAHAETQRKFPTCPKLAAVDTVAAEQLADHRREYLDFEGDLTHNRGSVIRVTAGTYELITESSDSLELVLKEPNDKWQLRLNCRTVRGACWQLKISVVNTL